MTTTAPGAAIVPPLTITVHGTPVPKGSTKAFWRPGMKHAVVTHDNARTKPWQESVVSAALDAVKGRPMIEEPVAIFVRFFMPRPKTAPKRVTEPAKKPDLDKLVRCLKDGLTRAGVYRDDSQVVCMVARKEFAGGYSDPEGDRGIPRAYVEIGLFADANVAFAWPTTEGVRAGRLELFPEP